MRVAPTPVDLAIGFASLALRGFGGLAGYAQHFLTREREWLSEEEYGELLAISQALPGPNFGNVAVLVGDRHAGTLGAVAAIAGFCVPSTVVAVVLLSVLVRLHHLPGLAAFEGGVIAGAAGLVVASGIRIARRYVGEPFLLGAIGVLVAVVLGRHVPIPIVVVAGVPIIMLLQRKRRKTP